MSDDPTTPAVASATTPPDGQKKLAPRDWLEIVGLAREGKPVRKIAKIYDVKPSSIYRGLKKRGVRIGSSLTAAAEVVENENRAKLIEQIRTSKDENFKATQAIKRRAIKLIGEADRDKKSYGSLAEDLKGLEIALKIVRSATDNEWKILGLDKDDDFSARELPELPIRELTDIEIATIRDRQVMEDDFDEDELDAFDDVIEGAEYDIAEEGDDEDDKAGAA